MKIDQKSLVIEFINRYPVKKAIGLRFGECRIHVAVNSHSVADELIAYFGDFVQDIQAPHVSITVHEVPFNVMAETFGDARFTVKTPDPGKTGIKEEYQDTDAGRIVRKRLTGMVFAFGADHHTALGPCLENINQVVNFINNRYIEWKLCQGCLLGHAAGVSHNGRGMALAGFSGAGKSTLALHMMSCGTTFVSNDRLMIEKNDKNETLIMHGVAKLPRINPGTILNNKDLIKIIPEADRQKFQQLAEDELWALEHKYDAPIDSCYGQNRFVLKSGMHGLAILNWNRDEKSETRVKSVDPLERADLLPAFMKSTGLFFFPYPDCRMPDTSVEGYADHLRKCSVLEFTGSVNFDYATNVCLSFLNTGQIKSD